jgi:hypothetical protein
MDNALFWSAHIRDTFLPQVRVLRETILQRFMPTFQSMSDEAEQVTEDAWQELGQRAGADVDPGDLAEMARDAGVDRYLMLNSAKQGLLNLFAVAVHHLVEQQQLFLLRREPLPRNDEFNHQLLNATEFATRLMASGIDISLYPSAAKLRELRLVANVVKHAEGPALSQLRQVRPDMGLPEFMRSTDLGNRSTRSALRFVYQPLAGEDVHVSEEDLAGYFDAAEEFWTHLTSDLRRLHEALVASRLTRP